MQSASRQSHLLATHRESQPDRLRRMDELCSRRGYGGHGTPEMQKNAGIGGDWASQGHDQTIVLRKSNIRYTGRVEH